MDKLSTSRTSDVPSASPISQQPKRTITLWSSEGTKFNVDERVAVQSEIIKTRLNDDGVNIHDVFPLPNIKAATLKKVIEFCEKHTSGEWAPGSAELKQWDRKFIENYDIPGLADILNAAHNMKIKSLLDLSTQRLADLKTDLPVEDVRKVFAITNDSFTPEEEEAVP